jgi:FSR family fosmidomycin resistance protein-like MFS transporter
MEGSVAKETVEVAEKMVEKTVFPILLTISFSHLLNDTIQSLIPSIYPIVKHSYRLSFSQVGLYNTYISTCRIAASTFGWFLY